MRTFRHLAVLVLLGTTALAGEIDHKKVKYSSFEELRADTAKKCELISHDCETCSFDENDKPMCSSSGFACVPRTWFCYSKHDY
jgi:hypothetical protein